MAIVNLTKDNLNETIENANQEIVLVDFWAPWCPPCRQFGPIYERVSELYPDYLFAKIDVEEYEEIRPVEGIESIPTVKIYKNKECVYNKAGALNQVELTALIEKIKIS